MPRSREEIMRDLKAILAELDYVMGSGPDTDPDVSPKLEQALQVARRDPEPKSHEEIRAQARAYKPADYTARDRPADDPDWPPDAVWMGTGDHKLIE